MECNHNKKPGLRLATEIKIVKSGADSIKHSNSILIDESIKLINDPLEIENSVFILIKAIYTLTQKEQQIHRARLRKIGIDIAQRFNLPKFSPVTVREIRQVKVSDCPIPSWYKMPQIFQLAS